MYNNLSLKAMADGPSLGLALCLELGLRMKPAPRDDGSSFTTPELWFPVPKLPLAPQLTVVAREQNVHLEERAVRIAANLPA